MTDDKLPDGDAEAIVQAIERLSLPTPIELRDNDAHECQEVVAVPKGMELKSLLKFQEERRAHPLRISGVAELETIESFCAYVNRFKGDNSLVFCSEGDGSPCLVAVIDHHGHVEGALPSFCRHRATYRFPMSDEWVAWNRANGQAMSQGEFAEFVEDRLLDVIEQDRAGIGAKSFASGLGVRLCGAGGLRDLSKGLKVRVDMTAAESHNVQSGETALHFAEAHNDTAGAPLTVPGGFVLGIPVFKRDTVYQLPVLLRYRVRGQITWTVKLHREDLVLRDALDGACDLVGKATELPVLHGTPER